MNSTTSADEVRGIRVGSFVVAIVAGYRAVAMFPTPAMLLSDHGHGYQLAGASEILAGRHPFIDFQDIYGPLPHYASAAGQWLAGGRVGGELALVVLSFAIGYAIFFRLMVRCAIPLWLALTMTFVAIAVQPASWRYYLLLLPMVFFAAAWRYVEVPSAARLWLMAAAVTTAGLFRPDLGVFTYVSGAVLVGMTGRDRKRARLQIVIFTGDVLVCALPWICWLAVHDKLWAYLANSSVDAIADAVGRARPAPDLDVTKGMLTVGNVKACLFRLPALLLVFAVAMLVMRRRELQGSLRPRLVCAITFVALSQAQASHIVDWMHVRDTLPMRIFFLAWIAAAATAQGSGGRGATFGRLLPRGIVAVVCTFFVVAVTGKESLSEFSARAVIGKLASYDCTRSELLASERKRGESFRANLYEYLRDHSAPDESIFAVIEAPQTNYFADRRLAGGQLAIFPGYFASGDQQQQLIARIRQGRTAFVIVDHLGQDEYPDLSLEKFAPDFFAFLQGEFAEVAQIGHCHVLVPRWRSAAVGAP